MCCYLVWWFLLISTFAAGSAEEVGRLLPAVRTGRPPVIDGHLDDPCWKSAPTATDFIDPYQNQPAKDQTFAFLLYDGEAIYVGFHALDSEPGLIVARQSKDQVRFSGEDTLAFSIDPYGTHQFQDRNFFIVNPLGAKYAHLAGGRAEKAEWIGLWEVAVQRVEDGWIAEMRIPWRILGYPVDTKPLAMRINFDRYQQRTGERSWWSNVGVQEYYERDGLWTGVIPPPPQRELDLMPYLYFGRQGSHGKNLIGRAGSDLRYRPTGELTLLSAVNPDFENIEQAVESIDFSYSARWVPDRRPFFQEGNEYFPSWFYSRRIEQIDAGAKLFGKLSRRWDAAFLSTYQRGGPFATVSQAKFAPNEKVNVGLGFGSRSGEGEPFRLLSLSAYGRVRNFHLRHDLMTSREGDTSAAQGAVYLGYYTTYGGWILLLEHVDPNMPVCLNFQPFDNYQGLGNQIWWELKRREGPIRSLYGSLVGNVTNNLDGHVFQRFVELLTNVHLRNDIGIRLSHSQGRFQEYRQEGTSNLSVTLRKSDRYTNATVGIKWGRREDRLYRSLRMEGRLRITSLNVGAELHFVERDKVDYQHIVTLNYDITKAMSLGGRMIWRKSGRNFYLALRRSGYAGTDLYLILGDPNAEAFQKRLVGKVVLAL